jgi:hypothetical protein
MKKQIILSALDMLAVQLATYRHKWSNDQRGLYEHAVEILKGGKVRTQPLEARRV